MTIGTEHEFSINDGQFNPLPLSDEILRAICGRYESEILFGDVKLGKELQKTVLEVLPRSPAEDLAALEHQLVRGIRKFNTMFRERYHLLGLGMHPTLKLGQTAVWDHDEGEYYEAYDRLFDIRQHGWLNIQALQINLSYAGEKDMVSRYNRIRSLLPYLIAVTASSPMVEGSLRPAQDNRLLFYRANQEVMPAICHGIIPMAINRVRDYTDGLDAVYADLRARDAAILCEEWVNSSGVIVRFSRRCLEIKALDEQECIRSDMAVCAFVRSLLRSRTLSVETSQDALLALTEDAIQRGTAAFREDLERLYRTAWTHATADERLYLPVIEDRICRGSLAERIRERFEREGNIVPILADMAGCLRTNIPYT
jgi:glutamate---cysteine ligase / carboxylate-amine ligase